MLCWAYWFSWILEQLRGRGLTFWWFSTVFQQLVLFYLKPKDKWSHWMVCSLQPSVNKTCFFLDDRSLCDCTLLTMKSYPALPDSPWLAVVSMVACFKPAEDHTFFLFFLFVVFFIGKPVSQPCFALSHFLSHCFHSPWSVLPHEQLVRKNEANER